MRTTSASAYELCGMWIAAVLVGCICVAFGFAISPALVTFASAQSHLRLPPPHSFA